MEHDKPDTGKKKPEIREPEIRRRPPAGEELHYHYSREEREAGRKRIWSPPTGSFFRRNRALAIILVDVIIVVLLFFIYLFFLRPLEGQIRIGEYRVSAQSFVLSEEVLITVTFSRPAGTMRRGGEPPTQPIVTVEAAGEVLSDLAPLPEHERSLAFRLPRTAVRDGEELEVTILIGDESETFGVPISFD